MMQGLNPVGWRENGVLVVFSLQSSEVYLFGSSPESAGHQYRFLWYVAPLIKLRAVDAASLDLFGFSVAISDNRAIVGAYHRDGDGGIGSGSAYLFTSEP